MRATFSPVASIVGARPDIPKAFWNAPIGKMIPCLTSTSAISRPHADGYAGFEGGPSLRPRHPHQMRFDDHLHRIEHVLCRW